MDEQDELVKEFLIESFEYLDSLDEDLLSLEKEASDPELLARIFRALHTIKGTGGFLDFDNLVAIAHAGEGLLDCLRSGTVEATEHVSSSLLELVDAIREVLHSIEDTGRDGEETYQELVKTLVSLQDGETMAEPAVAVQVEAEPSEEAEPEEEDEFAAYLRQTHAHLDAIYAALEDFPRQPLDLPRIREIQAALKGIVGPSSIMGFRKLISVMLGIRKKLDALMAGECTVTEAFLTALAGHVDAAKVLMGNIAETEEEKVTDFQALIDTHIALRENNASTQESATEVPADIAEKPKETAKPPAEAGTAPVKTPAPQPTKQAKNGAAEFTTSRRSLADNNIRVNVELLDALMNLVGELVLTRNQILQFTSTGSNPAFANSAQNLDLITTELQEGVMKTRMQTIGTIWKKFPRIVHDLAKSCDKKATIEMEGKETELDKTIIEAIKDPLTHLIRNAVDHGLELPAERVRCGKPETGKLQLRAFHEGGHVNIEIADDGAGIDPEKIKNKAIKNGLISESQGARMSDREIHNLIFVSGFSTAQQVSNISGRGVGMDVVKTYIERIGGTVDIHSKLGTGTTIKIKIPLTLAIIPALIVKVQNERFALPQVNLLELVRLEGDQIETHIELIHNTPVYRLRGKLLPLVYLDRELELASEPAETEEHDEDELTAINIVVLQAEDQPFGLVVQQVVDTEEVVVKPLTKLLKHQSTFAGATIMGDGKIALILDVAGLARKGGVMSQNENIKGRAEATFQKEDSERTTLLLARVTEDRQVAIPLSMISRLEEIDANAIEQTGRQEIIQYRGDLMPLIRLTNLLNLPAPNDTDANECLQVVVCQKNGVNIGMVVDAIVDIVEEQIVMQERSGFVKSVAIIQNRATDLLSIEEVLDTVDTGIFERTTVAPLQQ
ncbi:MAG: chemotaxis protein CheW [Bacteroidota bacterium]